MRAFKALILVFVVCLSGSVFSPLNAATINLTVDEKQWLAEHPTVTVGIHDSAPYGYMDNGVATGYSIDLLKTLLDAVGIDLKFTAPLTLEESLDKLKQGESDITYAIVKTAAREEYLRYSPLPAKIDLALFSQTDAPLGADITSLDGKRISSYHDYALNPILKKFFPHSTILYADSIVGMLRQVSSDKADFCVQEVFSGKYNIREHFLPNVDFKGFVNFPGINLEAHHWAVRKDQPLLYSIINKSLAQLSEAKQQQLWDKWFALDKRTLILQQGSLQLRNKLQLSAEEKAYLANKETLKVATLSNFYPFNFSQNQRPMGYTIDVMKLLGEVLDKQIEFIETPWNVQLDLLKQGQIDIIPHIAITEERQKFIDYTDTTFISFLIGIASLSTQTIDNMADLEGKSLAMVNSYYLQKHLETNFPKTNLLLTSTTEEAINAVIDGKADAVIDNVPTLRYFIREQQLNNLELRKIQDFGMPLLTDLPTGVKKGNPQLRSILDKTYAALPPQQLSELKKDWLATVDPPFDQFSVGEKEFLRQHPQVRFRVRSNQPPIEFSQQGKAQGIAVDYIATICENVGIKPVFVIDDRPLEQAYQELDQRKSFDSLLYTVKTTERTQQMAFGDSFLSFPLTLITNKKSPYISSLEGLSDETLAVEKGYISKKWLQRDFPELTIIEAPDTWEALKLVNKGDVDAYLGNLATANYAMAQGMDNLRVAAPSNYKDIEYSFVAPKQWPELASILSKGSRSLTAEQNNSLKQKWFTVKLVKQTDYRLFWQAGTVIALLILWILGWNWRLNRRVKVAVAIGVENERRRAQLHQSKQKVEQEFERERRMHTEKARFLDIISHDYRTPLAAIKTQLDIFKLRPTVNDRQKEILEISIKRLEDLFNSALQKSIPNMATMDFGLLTVQVLNQFKNLQGSCRIESSGTEQQLLIRGHQELLKTLLYNLLENACKYRLKGNAAERVKLSLTNDGNNAVLALSNPVDPDLQLDQESLFDRRTRGPNTDKANGYGLGLNLVRHIVDDHQGTTRIDNSTAGLFIIRVSLPLDKEALSD